MDRDSSSAMPAEGGKADIVEDDGDAFGSCNEKSTLPAKIKNDWVPQS